MTIHGRYKDKAFIPDSPLPDTEGIAELVITPARPHKNGSIADAYGKASTLRRGDEILAQNRADRDEWGNRD